MEINIASQEMVKCSKCHLDGHMCNNKKFHPDDKVSTPVSIVASESLLYNREANRLEYQHLENLQTVCNGFKGKKITLTANFGGRSIQINNPNLVGDLLEDVFFPFYKEACPDFEEGPKQESPDFHAQGKNFDFEQKAFTGSPGFDISNFTSFVHQLSKPGGLEKKIFKTKYLVYEYKMENDAFIIKDVWILNIWDLPVYDKTYPISVQVKKKMWYNIRPGAKSGWNDKTKTPTKFLAKLIECIDLCAHLDNSSDLKASILIQMEEAKIRGLL